MEEQKCEFGGNGDSNIHSVTVTARTTTLFGWHWALGSSPTPATTQGTSISTPSMSKELNWKILGFCLCLVKVSLNCFATWKSLFCHSRGLDLCVWRLAPMRDAIIGSNLFLWNYDSRKSIKIDLKLTIISPPGQLVWSRSLDECWPSCQHRLLGCPQLVPNTLFHPEWEICKYSIAYLLRDWSRPFAKWSFRRR